MSAQIKSKYDCTQPELYGICELGWNLLKPIDVQTKVELVYPEYTALYIDQKLSDVQKAEELPDSQARDLPTESAHIILKQLAIPAVQNWRFLARYINRAFQSNPELIKPNVEAAGQQYLEPASRENPNWEDVKHLLVDGKKYLTDNATTLAPFMPANFDTDFTTAKKKFDDQYAIFIMAKATSPVGTAQKVTANNNIYDDLILMTEDIRELVPTIFKDEITFAHLKGIISSPGPAGLKGLTTEAGTNSKITGVLLRLLETDYEATSNEDALYDFGNIASGKYTIEVSKDGYQTYTTDIVIAKGVTSTKNYALVKNS